MSSVPEPAHRVEQCAALGVDLRPAGAQQHRGGEILLQRRLALQLAPAAAMQRAAGKIQRQRGAVAAQAHVDAHVRLVGIHAGSLAVALAELVDHRILHPLRQVLAVGELAQRGVRIDRQRGVAGEMARPVDGLHAGIQRLVGRRVELAQRQQHAAGQARPQAGTVGGFQRAGKVHARDRLAGVFGTECGQFVLEQVFQALRAAGEECRHARAAS
jgi:hypothetical protein